MADVSVVIPAYNREDLLFHAIQSVKNQTFENWEMVVVDDCSTDGTRLMVNSHSWNDHRIRYFCTSHNSGNPVMPRNIGVVNSQAPLIAFLDSDDEWCEEKLRMQLEFMKLWRSSFSYHDMRVVYPGGREEEWRRMSAMHSGNVFYPLLRKNFIPTSSVIISRSLYRNSGGMRKEFDVSHDWDLWLRIAYRTPVHALPVSLGTLRVHDSGSVINETHRRRSESRRVVRAWKNYCEPKFFRKILTYYYIIEVMDMMPAWGYRWLRKKWYSQSRYK